MRGASRPVDLSQWRGKRGGSAVRAARLGFYRGVRLQGEVVTAPSAFCLWGDRLGDSEAREAAGRVHLASHAALGPSVADASGAR